MFLPLYWIWVGTAIQADLRDVERPRTRLLNFAVALCSLFMALAVPGAHGGVETRDRGLIFALAYWAARLMMGLSMPRGQRFSANPYTWSMLATGPLFVIGAPAGHLTERFGLFVLVALGEAVVSAGAPAADVDPGRGLR